MIVYTFLCQCSHLTARPGMVIVSLSLIGGNKTLRGGGWWGVQGGGGGGGAGGGGVLSISEHQPTKPTEIAGCTQVVVECEQDVVGA